MTTETLSVVEAISDSITTAHSKQPATQIDKLRCAASRLFFYAEATKLGDDHLFECHLEGLETHYIGKEPDDIVKAGNQLYKKAEAIWKESDLDWDFMYPF